MGASRMGYNLLSVYGRKNFQQSGGFFNRGVREYWFKDTFGKYICQFIGHSKTFNTDDNPPWKVCYRCFKKTECTECGKTLYSEEEVIEHEHI